MMRDAKRSIGPCCGDVRVGIYRGLALALVVAMIAALGSSCGAQCEVVKKGYQSALEDELGLRAAEGGGEIEPGAREGAPPTHFGLAMRFGALDRLIGTGVDALLREGLDVATSTLSLSGKEVTYRIDGRPVDLSIGAAEACPHCFRVEGKLDGTITLVIPLLGEQKIPLSGELSLVAPLMFRRAEEGGGLLMLDLGEVAKYTRGAIVSADIVQLPPTWKKALEMPLTRALTTKLAEELEPVTLFHFRGPDLGVEGLEVLPAVLRTDPDAKTLFVGFTSNLPGIEGSVAPVLDLEEDAEVAVAVHPQSVIHALTIAMRQERVPRRYTMQGDASARGPSHVTMDALRMSRGGALGLSFRAWNFGESVPCFWFDALATIRAGFEDGELAISLEGVEITASSLPEAVQRLGNWASAQFLEEGVELLRRALRAPRIEVPGASVSLDLSGLDMRESSLVARAKLGIESASKK